MYCFDQQLDILLPLQCLKKKQAKMKQNYRHHRSLGKDLDAAVHLVCKIQYLHLSIL